MSTISQLKTNHDTVIRQKTAPKSISTDNHADLLDGLADEVLDRGVTQVLDTTELQALSGANYRNVVVKDNGIYKWKASGTPNGTTIFAATGGGVYEKQFGAIQNLIVDTTYANLVTLINSSSLIIGLKYRITDFATRHFLIDPSQANGQNVAVTFTGDNEPLIVTAIDVNKLDKVATSLSYPQDIIHYDWNPANWLTDVGFSDITDYDYVDKGTCAIISNFKGVIYYRKDTIVNVEVGNDFRQVKYRSWKLDGLVWDSGTTYNRNSLINYAGHLYISMIDSNTNNNPTIFSTNKWAKVTTYSPYTTEYLGVRPTGSSFNLSNAPLPLDFEDTTMFKRWGVDNARIENVKSVMFDNADVWNYGASILQNNVFNSYCYSVDYSRVLNSRFIEDQRYNTIHGYISNSLVSKFFSNVVKDQINISVVCGNVSHNEFGFVFATTVRDNTINSKIQSIQSSNFGCNNCQMTGAIINCQSTQSFKRVHLDDDMSNIDFVSAGVLVNQNYKKSLFKNSSGVLRLSYFNGSDVLTIANPTD